MLARLRARNLHRWLGGYAVDVAGRALRPGPAGPRHLIFALCDHYEPLWKGASPSQGRERVQAWLEGYPAVFGKFRDADGRSPRHTFFFPGEQYAPEYLEPLRDALAGAGAIDVQTWTT